jgi:hypothetical protein
MIVTALQASPHPRVWVCNEFSAIDAAGSRKAHSVLSEYSLLQRSLDRSRQLHDVYWVPQAEMLEVLLATSIVRGSNIAIARDQLPSDYAFDRALSTGEDLDFVMRCSRRLDCLFIDQPLSAYRIRGDSMSIRSADRNVPARLQALYRQKALGFTREQRRAFKATVADNLRVWAYELKSQGRFQEALPKYVESLTYSPSWFAFKGVVSCVLRYTGNTASAVLVYLPLLPI